MPMSFPASFPELARHKQGRVLPPAAPAARVRVGLVDSGLWRHVGFQRRPGLAPGQCTVVRSGILGRACCFPAGGESPADSCGVGGRPPRASAGAGGGLGEPGIPPLAFPLGGARRHAGLGLVEPSNALVVGSRWLGKCSATATFSRAARELPGMPAALAWGGGCLWAVHWGCTRAVSIVHLLVITSPCCPGKRWVLLALLSSTEVGTVVASLGKLRHRGDFAVHRAWTPMV